MRLFWSRLCSISLMLVVYTGCGITSPATDIQEIKSQWYIVETKEKHWPSYWLVNKEYPRLKQEMFIAGPIANNRPWISEVVEANREKAIYLIVYYAGQPGTSELVDTYYALIYDAGNHTILGHYPYHYISHRYDYSPEWVFDNRQIIIRGEDFEPVVIDLEN